jgi:leucyl aminopeptidase
MIKICEKINVKHHLVILFDEKTTDKTLASALPSPLSENVLAHKKAGKLSSNSIHEIQLTGAPDTPRVLLINVGNHNAPMVARKWASDAARKLRHENHVQWLSFTHVDDWELWLSQVIVMALYEPLNYKSNQKKMPLSKHSLVTKNKALVTEGVTVATAVNKARHFANAPANILTTTQFVNDIVDLFKNDDRYNVKVMNESELKKKKMNALLGVGQGSSYPSYLVDITYKGARTGAPIAIIGKGVVFDTGGISIKPSRSMKDMKGDMGGAAATVAAAWAVGQMKLKRNASFIVPIVENMVSSTAQRPGDVVVASNGTSIEITNTDAEGRLILADALVYASKKNPQCMVDIATLTGASTIAVGPYAIPAMGNEQSVVDQLLAAGQVYNERLWQLPLFEEYKELLASDVADILNANEGREAGTITAAMFLAQFVGNIPWGHLDIASTMMVSSTKGDQVKGMTGAGTRTLISFIKHFKFE